MYSQTDPNRRLRAASLATILVLLASTALAAGPLSKKDWSQLMRGEQRAEEHLCHDKAWLRTCTSEFDEGGAKTTLTKAMCEEAVTMVVQESLDDGSDDQTVGAFYNQLPANIGDGYQMDHYAEMLGQLAGSSVLDAIKANGGTELATPKCLLSKGSAWKVPGNP